MRGFKRGGVEVRVDLRGRQIGMTKHFLDGTKIRAALEKMRREGMPQQMGMQFLFDAGPNAELF